MSTSRPSSPRLSATARREQILDVALEVFGRAGFHGASMNDVADAAGVTKPVLYQHFDSKRELYRALLEEVGSRLLSAIAPGGDTTPPALAAPTRASCTAAASTGPPTTWVATSAPVISSETPPASTERNGAGGRSV